MARSIAVGSVLRGDRRSCCSASRSASATSRCRCRQVVAGDLRARPRSGAVHRADAPPAARPDRAARRRRVRVVGSDLPESGPQPARQPRHHRHQRRRLRERRVRDRRARVRWRSIGDRRRARRRVRHGGGDLLRRPTAGSDGVPARARRHRRERHAHRGHVVPADPGRDLRRPAGDGVADRLAQRPGMGARPSGRRWRWLVLVPAVLVLARGLRALQLGDDTAKGLGVRGRTDPCVR